MRANLAGVIKESGAVVTQGDPLPNVLADQTQLIQLFQNLIGNGIKFRGERPPQIHVSARRDGDHWEFAVRDNGIGIEPQYLGADIRDFPTAAHAAEICGDGDRIGRLQADRGAARR